MSTRHTVDIYEVFRLVLKDFLQKSMFILKKDVKLYFIQNIFHC